MQLSKSYIALFLATKLLFSEAAFFDNDKCVEQKESCKEDCDCCGFDSISGIVCQTRNHHLGPRCHTFRRHGEPCTASDQCRSQNCNTSTGVCEPTPRVKVGNPALLCPVTLPTDDLTGIIGTLTTEENTCPCTDSAPFPEESCDAILMKKPYTNNYAINSGFTVTPTYHFPLRKLVFCTSDQPHEYDPSCFKLEGRCKGSHEFTTVQEGALLLPLQRNKCQKIHVVDQNYLDRKEYAEFRLTFPCQRGGFTNTCREGCQDYPMRLGMIRMMGNCRDRNYCKLKAAALFDVSGSYWESPPGGCPHCAHSTDSPRLYGPGKTIDGTSAPYVNYKGAGSGLIFERVEKPVNFIRFFPSSTDAASDPISYEVYGAKYQQEFLLISSGVLNFPAERNTAELKHYTDVFLTNNIDYENLKIVFPDIEGNFDTTCDEGNTCKDYPLVVGEIELFGWC